MSLPVPLISQAMQVNARTFATLKLDAKAGRSTMIQVYATLTLQYSRLGLTVALDMTLVRSSLLATHSVVHPLPQLQRLIRLQL